MNKPNSIHHSPKLCNAQIIRRLLQKYKISQSNNWIISGNVLGELEIIPPSPLQIWYEKGVHPSVVVLIKWKFPHSLTLVENFMLKVRKGTVADVTTDENENEFDSYDSDMEKRSKKVMNLLVSRDNIPRNSTSIMLKIKRFKAG